MGLIYIMWNFPYLHKVKIGISTTGKTAKRRRDISRTTKGIAIPIFFSILPFGVHKLEKDLHRICKPIHAPFKKGSGKTEWFLFPAALVAIPLIIITTAVYWSPLIILILTVIK